MPDLQDLHRIRAELVEAKWIVAEYDRVLDCCIDVVDTEMKTAIEQAREQSPRRRHLKVISWIGAIGVGAVKAWDWASTHRIAATTYATTAVAGLGVGATIACQSPNTNPNDEARMRPPMAAPPANPSRPTPTTQPPKATPRTAPPPSPTPTRVPTVQIHATPAPAPEPLATTPRKTKPPKPPGNNGRPPTRPPVTRPPATPPGQVEPLDECLIHRELIWDIQLFC